MVGAGPGLPAVPTSGEVRATRRAGPGSLSRAVEAGAEWSESGGWTVPDLSLVRGLKEHRWGGQVVSTALILAGHGLAPSTGDPWWGPGAIDLVFLMLLSGAIL